MQAPTNIGGLLAAASRRDLLIYAGAALLLAIAVVLAGDEIRLHGGAIETPT